MCDHIKVSNLVVSLPEVVQSRVLVHHLRKMVLSLMLQHTIIIIIGIIIGEGCVEMGRAQSTILHVYLYEGL